MRALLIRHMVSVRNDRGQGALEYIGVLAVVAVVIAAVIAGFTANAGAISTGITTLITGILGGGAAPAVP